MHYSVDFDLEYNTYQKWLIFLFCCQQFAETSNHTIDQKHVFSLLTGESLETIDEIAENACAQGHVTLIDEGNNGKAI